VVREQLGCTPFIVVERRRRGEEVVADEWSLKSPVME
jgi:hypothetical protein